MKDDSLALGNDEALTAEIRCPLLAPFLCLLPWDILDAGVTTVGL